MFCLIMGQELNLDCLPVSWVCGLTPLVPWMFWLVAQGYLGVGVWVFFIKQRSDFCPFTE